jgi:putative two-component system response regulator
MAKAAQLHDIGKVGTPDSILQKPAKLTTKEYELMKSHATIGRDALTIVAGEAIPLSARLMALADVCDALTRRRVHKSALSHEQAKAIIVEARGRHFDPAVVDAFLPRDREFADIAKPFREGKPPSDAA